MQGPTGRPASARLLALAFFGDIAFDAGDSDSDEYAAYLSP